MESADVPVSARRAQVYLQPAMDR